MLKLALLQCDVKTGDLAANAARILEFCHKAPDSDLCVAPLEALIGPNAACFCRQPDFERLLGDALAMLAAGLPEGQALLCGTPSRGPVLVRRAGIGHVDTVFALGDVNIGIDLAPHEYGNIALNIHMAARPFASTSQSEWELILAGATRQTGIWAVSVNLAGGYGQHIYNGQSVAVSPDGVVAARGAAFAEDCVRIDLARPECAAVSPLCASLQEAQWLALTLGLRDFMRKNGAQKAVIGLSGGMDSALVACIACDALGPQSITGVLMPSRYTSPESVRDAGELAANLGILTLTVDIEPVVAAFHAALAPGVAGAAPRSAALMAENLQARVRGVLLMSLANASGAFVLNTGNKSEASMGYSTLYGDTVGALAVIGDLFKTQVYALARWRCGNAGHQLIPQNIFDRPPSAELAPGQKDTDSLPPYDDLDPDLAAIMAFSPKLADPQNAGLAALRVRVGANAFKRRQCPPALLVSSLQPCGDA